MSKRAPTDDSPFLIIFLIYLLPIFGWVTYCYLYLPLAFSWIVAILGMAILFTGSALLLTLVRSLKDEMPELAPELATIKAPTAPLIKPEPQADESLKYKKEIAELQSALQNKNQEILSRGEQIQSIGSENSLLKEKLAVLQEQQAVREDAAHRKLDEIQLESHQRQQIIQQLENQILDLRYEIKTLLQLTEVDYSHFGLESPKPLEQIPEELPVEHDQKEEAPLAERVTNIEDARRLLKRCIDIAQKMTGGYRSTSMNSLSATPYAFDLRRLADALRLESGALIVLYSPKDERILYASREAKALLDVSPEKLSVNFDQILQESSVLWKGAMAQLLTKSESCLALTLNSKNGTQISLQALLGPIPTGIFRSLVLGIIYPDQSH